MKKSSTLRVRWQRSSSTPSTCWRLTSRPGSERWEWLEIDRSALRCTRSSQPGSSTQRRGSCSRSTSKNAVRFQVRQADCRRVNRGRDLREEREVEATDQVSEETQRARSKMRINMSMERAIYRQDPIARITTTPRRLKQLDWIQTSWLLRRWEIKSRGLAISRVIL